EWGGDVEVIQTSAITGAGIDNLLETLLAIAELNEYVADPERDALGVCLEAQQEGGRGVVAKVIVRKGTLRVGDIIVCGPSHGRVKAMYDTLNPTLPVEEAGPSTPVNITGLDVAPGAGDAFYVLDDITEARQIAETRATSSHTRGLSGQGTTKISFERFQELLADGRLGQTEEATILNVIIRADVQGSLEAINKEFEKLEHPEVQIKILQQSVGGITIGDVHLADASNAVILGFNVIPDEAARSLADDRKIEIRRYDIIYKMTEDLKAMLEGKLKPEERVIDLGRALVKQVFAVSKAGTIAGCYVIQGAIERGCRIRVNRDGRTIGDYPLDSLRRIKDDVKEVTRGLECGMKLSGFNDIKQDDVLEAYKIEEFARTL
ncbi:MAG: translation initiation factor IF-2, partial [Planctomycetia bacterium]|nr:translation initiation factor IF-2 [Planctomycetia bacterium]